MKNLFFRPVSLATAILFFCFSLKANTSSKIENITFPPNTNRCYQLAFADNGIALKCRNSISTNFCHLLNDSTTESYNPLASALWWLIRSALGGIIGNYAYDKIKSNINNYSDEMDWSARRSSRVKRAKAHLINQWTSEGCEKNAYRHLKICSICRNTFNDVTNGTGISFSNL